MNIDTAAQGCRTPYAQIPGHRTESGILLCLCLAWLFLIQGSLAIEPGFTSIFNGKDLSGWDGEEGLWRVVDGAIEGGKPDGGPVERSSFMFWREGELKDFHLKLKCRITKGNSGIQYRSRNPHGYGVRGYQAEVAGLLSTGFLHQQGKSGPKPRVGQSVINEGGKGVIIGEVSDTKWMMKEPYYVQGEWADYDIIVRGNHHLHYVNGYPCIEYIDRDEIDEEGKKRVPKGLLALQVHSGKEMKVWFKDIRIKHFAKAHGDALRIGDSLDGWSGDAGVWKLGLSATATDKQKRNPDDAPKVLICDGTGSVPLTRALSGPAVLHYQRFTGKEAASGPFKAAKGWESVETVVTTGQVSLPSDLAAEYRNIVIIPIQEAP